MAKLPRVSGREAIRAFERAGWEIQRQRGSHVVLKKPGVRYHLTVPDHQELKTGTLQSLIRKAGLTRDEFRNLL